MKDTSSESDPYDDMLLLDRIGVQSGLWPRGIKVANDLWSPGWNEPLTAEERKRALARQIAWTPAAAAFLERDDYDTELHARVEESFIANYKAAHARLDLLIDLFKACFPTAISATLIMNAENDRLELERVSGQMSVTLSTGEEDGLGVHRYTVRDLIEQLGPEPYYTLDDRLTELKRKGQRRRFRLPFVTPAGRLDFGRTANSH